MVCTEKKSEVLLMTLLNKYSGPGDVVLDRFAGSMFTERVCISLPVHRRYIICDIDMACFDSGMRQLAEFYAKELLDLLSYITGDDHLRRAPQVYVGNIKRKACAVQKYLQCSAELSGSAKIPPLK